MTVLALTLPAGWRAVDLSRDRDSAIAAAVDHAFTRADRDSSAAAKHWMRQRLIAASTVPADGGAEVVSLLYPERATAGIVLPVTAQVLLLSETALPVAEEPMKVLAALATRDDTSKPVPGAGGLALRTHAARDIRDAFVAEVDTAPLSPEERASIEAATPRTMHALRVSYVLPPARGGTWHAVVFSALLAEPSPAVADVVMALCDAFVEAARWRDL